MHLVKCFLIQTDVSDGVKTRGTCQFENRGCMQCSVRPSHGQRVFSSVHLGEAADENSLEG